MVFALAFISCFLNSFPLSTQLLLFAVLTVSFFQFLRSKVVNYLGIKKISCRADGFFELLDGGGEAHLCKLQASTTILGSFFFLHFAGLTKRKAGKLHLVLANDSLTVKAARQLRVTLNVYKQEVLGS